MNFKISVKTWLKFAKQRLRQLERERAIAIGAGIEGLTSNDDDENNDNKKIKVEIEVEEFHEFTSEEEDLGIVSSNTKRFGTGMSNHVGSSNDLAALVTSQNTEKKKPDHLKLFEKKMTSKFKNHNSMKKSSQKNISMRMLSR